MEGLVIKIPSVQTSPDSIRKKFNEGIIWPLRNLFGESWTGKYWPRRQYRQVLFDINSCLQNSHYGLKGHFETVLRLALGSPVSLFRSIDNPLAHGFLSIPKEVYFFAFFEDGTAILITEFRLKMAKRETRGSWREIINKILEIVINYFLENRPDDNQISLFQQNLANLSALEPSEISTP